MSLKELIHLAKEQSPEFTKKYEYWTLKRKKIMDLAWLMDELTEVLGREFVSNAAKEEITQIMRPLEDPHGGRTSNQIQA